MRQEGNPMRWTPQLLPIALLCAFVAIVYFALIHKSQTTPQMPPPGVNAAPPLKLIKFSTGVKQKLFDIKEMRGEKVLVNFFASWCIPCIAELPMLRKIARQNSLAIVGVAYNDSYDAVLNFFMRYDNAYARVLLDQNGRAAIDWGLRGVPESYLVDERGNLLAHYAGPLSDLVWAQTFARYFPPATVP